MIMVSLSEEPTSGLTTSAIEMVLKNSKGVQSISPDSKIKLIIDSLKEDSFNLKKINIKNKPPNNKKEEPLRF